MSLNTKGKMKHNPSIIFFVTFTNRPHKLKFHFNLEDFKTLNKSFLCLVLNSVKLSKVIKGSVKKRFNI